MDIEKDIPNLYQFFGDYINQDFNYEFGSLEGAIDSFFSDCNKNELIKIADEMEHILSLDLNDKNFDNLLEQAGCEYYTYADNLTGKQWVRSLQKRIYEQVYS